MGWGSAAAKLLDEPVWVTSPDRSSQGVDLDEEGMLLEEVDALHSESEGESSQRTEGHDPGNRMLWAALLLEHTRVRLADSQQDSFAANLLGKLLQWRTFGGNRAGGPLLCVCARESSCIGRIRT